MLLAEEFVLLALTPAGKPARGYSNHSATATGVTGALLTEVSQGGHLDVIDEEVHLTERSPAIACCAKYSTTCRRTRVEAEASPFEHQSIRVERGRRSRRRQYLIQAIASDTVVVGA